MKQVRTFLEMIKFEHTIFALPFAYLGMVLAAGGWPTWWQFIWITLAMASARTLAMAVNRAVDASLDAANPRTANRPIPRGEFSLQRTWLFAALSLAILTLAAWMLNAFVVRLLPFAVIALIGYSYTKRFTWLSHFVLGITDGAAAAGAWAAVAGNLSGPLPWLLWFAVTVWIAGFDLIYACQDMEFDRREGLYSIPARFGVAAALRLAQLCHLFTVLTLLLVGLLAPLGWPFWLGLALVCVLLAYEHSLVSPDDLSKVNLAFFTVNGYISVIAFVATLVALLVRSS